MKDFFDDDFVSGSINDDEEEIDVYEEIEKEKEKQKNLAMSYIDDAKKEEEERQQAKEEEEAYQKKEKEKQPDEPKDDEIQRVNALEEEFQLEAGNPKLNRFDVDKYITFIVANSAYENAEKSVREKIDILSKNIAAYMLLRASNTEKFSESLIKKNAEKVKQTFDLSNMHEVEIDRMLSEPDELVKGVNSHLRDLYGRPKDLKAYVDQMKKLSDSLMSSDNRTADYKNMVKCIKEVSELNPNDAMLSEDEIISRNYKALEAVEKYMKGKKRVRKTDAGVEHFDNALDALSIMVEHNPMLADKAQSIVDRINYVRGAEAENHKDHVDLANYGAERAVKAKEKRIEKSKEKKRELTMDKSKLMQKDMMHPRI